MPVRPDPALAALLKRLREERSLTQEQLAFDAHLTVSALSRIERGLSSPGWATVSRLAMALGVRVAEVASAVEKRRPRLGR
ncbi:MAG: helix-turn-helix domain-containing protein [Solirubrobacteraceae bacterium]